MAGKVKVTCGQVQLTATLNDTETAKAIYESLPIEGLAQTGTGYVFVMAPLSLGEEQSTDQVTAGALAYWPAGSAVCLFYGGQPPTEVNVIGGVNGNALVARNIISGTVVKIEKA